jgi:septal ring factor EnvC (AmiA/AmiB activator)
MCSSSMILYNKKLFFLILLLLIPLTAFTQLNENEQMEKLHDELKEDLSKEKKTLKEVVKKEEDFLSEIDRLNRILSQEVKKLDNNTQELVKTQEAIKNLEKDIDNLISKISKKKAHLNQRLEEIYKHHRARRIAALMSSKGYGEFLKKIKYLELLFRYDKKIVSDYVNKIDDLRRKKQELSDQYEHLEDIQQKLKANTQEIVIKREKKDTLLRQVQNEKIVQKKIIKELEASTRHLLKKIEEERDKERERKQQEEQKKVIKRKIAEEKKKKAQQFFMYKGKLNWPIENDVILSFGSQRSHGLNVPVLRNGIVIKAEAGTDVHAIARGVVVFSDWFKGYGNLLIINHGGGYHSLYAHLDESLLPVGEKVEPLQVVGRVGESGLLNKSGLYFELRYKGKPVNPLKWLRKRHDNDE